ncbi:MAG: hypothetical protein MK105_02125 [Crocinitomicaceae bacterium]|nr:hypothetical protein [Crocinitomicaceae bacterium]
MRHLLKVFTCFIFASTILIACSKTAGKGGTSSIKGEVNGVTLSGGNGNLAEKERTTVICNHADGIGGSILDNSDYFLLNTPEGGTLYYVWYENTNWLGQDPGLSGRTGIKVTYSNNDSNSTLASNTMTAINLIAGSDFTVSLNNDILTIENTIAGEVVDADDVNTPFVIDTENQGKAATIGNSIQTSGAIADERVYLIYGDEDFYSETVRTDENGKYQFTGLTKGNYRIFAFSLDTTTAGGLLHQVEVEASISKNKSISEAPSITIIR